MPPFGTKRPPSFGQRSFSIADRSCARAIRSSIFALSSDWRERTIEILEHLPPAHFAFFDLVQLPFHVGREFDVEESGNWLHHDLGDGLAQRSRREPALLERHVARSASIEMMDA